MKQSETYYKLLAHPQSERSLSLSAVRWRCRARSSKAFQSEAEGIESRPRSENLESSKLIIFYMLSFDPQWVRWDPLTWGRPLATGLSLPTDLSIHLKKTNKQKCHRHRDIQKSPWILSIIYMGIQWPSQVVTHPSHWENLCLHSSVVPVWQSKINKGPSPKKVPSTQSQKGQGHFHNFVQLANIVGI